MSKPNLNIMDIYEDMLKDNYELCEKILTEDYGYTEQQFFREFNHILAERGFEDLSNRLVQVMFNVTEELIKDKNPKADVDYYINGTLDTHFYIDGEQM